MGIHLLSIKPAWHCGLQQHQNSSWRLAAFSLCIVLIIQQSVTLSLPPPAAAPAPAPAPTPSVVVAESSLALISLPQLNDGAASSSLPSASELAVEHETTILTPGQMVINAVPKEDRASFFTYQLAVGLRAIGYMRQETQWLRNLEDVIGYFEQQAPHLKDVPIYENFPSDLLRWLMEKFQLLPEDVYNQLRSRSNLLCTSEGVCYSHKDVVCFCCPF